MASYLADITEAVKDSLNAPDPGEFSVSFTAARKYLPTTSPDSIQSLAVTVAMKSDEAERSSRTDTMHTVAVDVGIQKRLTGTANPEAEAANDEIDALAQLAEEVAAHFDRGALATTGARFMQMRRSIVYFPDHMQQKVFTAVVTFTFRKLT